MKRTVTKEIFIEIETIRITRKRSVREKPAQQPKADVSNNAASPVKNWTRLRRLFDKLV